MTPISHHMTDDILADYADGRLAQAFAVVVAAHISICDECRARVEAADTLGGVLLQDSDGVAMSADRRDRMMAALDQPVHDPIAIGPSGIFPGAVMQALNGNPPRWRMLGGGIRQQILIDDNKGSLRLLYIPPGRAVPEHGHQGIEMTLVLQGSFSDSAGRFGRGDVELAHDDVNHQPIADPGEACICLAATDAPLRFNALIPRLLQPLFRI
ncbi:ChrR family anti-sigma-E factor [Paracoccus laeviglucosivorans]|uniref:Anti-ECFsigma factor, ChrR n=1 Tax=Paracoccus laeviglucosivorans TaxID=1197861 RepID=A0A521FCV6_9RHOB|nr:ChrR family anti-sigma-E factor [Paracoccus laeviglucosivorans]SMO94028.1 anti-ECFsigma factor, ChrR [Paracoccus laeviglucosivorans]